MQKICLKRAKIKVDRTIYFKIMIFLVNNIYVCTTGHEKVKNIFRRLFSLPLIDIYESADQ